ncbi:alpha/beta fold hydrolase [Nonomuraea dietziae]|uniref:alpha/beta fold hydrolase n=1 Tax=Nonomuraea dietziae TaxID=65515 RepID=UPI0036063906
MPTLDINGLVIAYSDTGGSGQPVILGHGYFTDHTVFDAQAEFLSPQWRIIAWDARGHGNTPDSAKPYTYWDQARDALALMDHLQLRQAIVGGISQGGFIALRTALLAPDRVTALILSDTEATPATPPTRSGTGKCSKPSVSTVPSTTSPFRWPPNSLVNTLDITPRTGEAGGRTVLSPWAIQRCVCWNEMTSATACTRSRVPHC